MTAQIRSAPRKIIFVTGTDTGVGKTLLAGLLLFHLRRSGCHALAMKPFCSGGTEDVKFLDALQDGELRREEVCPFSFEEPVAPLIAARMRRRKIELAEVLSRIRELASRGERLIVEGCGGLFVPLGEGYTVASLVRRLNCHVVVVARNRLGTINHTLLTAGALEAMGVRSVQVVLMDEVRSDFSSRSNKRVLRELLAPVRLLSLACLGADPVRVEAMERNHKKVKKTLAELVQTANLCPVLPRIGRMGGRRKAC